MKKEPSINMLRQRIKAKIRKIGEADIFISGSFIRTGRKCGNPKCNCASGGDKHPCCMLSSKVRGKTKGIYIPVGLSEEVEQWVKEHKRIKAIMKEIDQMSEQIIRKYVQTNRAVNRNRKNLEE
ncbi:MAG: hypothetical protein KOO65_09825 [Desulfobacterales bacterium]|nr:hypothetical protein [Desulfobacterales bacterium]